MHGNILPEGFKMTELGPLPEEWGVARLGDVAETYSGGTPARDNVDYWNGEIPWVKSGELNDAVVRAAGEFISEEGLKNSSAKYVEKDTLLIAMYGATAGKAGLAKSRFAINQAICAVVPNERFNSTFYLYQIISARRRLLAERFGGAQPNLNQQVIKNLRVPLPPPGEQKRIAAVLSAVQEAKEKTEAVIQAAKELKKSFMKHLFTYGSVSIKEAENVPLKETEIGSVPEDWQVLELGDAIERSQYGLSLRAGAEGKYPILGMNNLHNGIVDLESLKYIDLDTQTYLKFKLRKDDVLFNRTNSHDLVGKTSLFDADLECVFASYLIRLSVDSKRTIPEFLNYYMNLDRVQRDLKKLASRGVSQSNISATKLKQIPVSLPPVPVQQVVSDCLSAVDQKILAEQNKKKALGELFKTLLDNLMTAKIRVPLAKEGSPSDSVNDAEATA